MSNQFLKLRRSAVPGKIPDAGSLALGEIALNTYDGVAFMKKDGPNGEEIVTIGNSSGSFSGSFSGEFTGSLLGTASWAYNASTASTADDFFVRGDITGSNALFTGTLTAQTLVVQTVTSSVIYSSGSNIFGNKLTDTQQFTGSVTITGSFEVDGSSTFNDSVTANNLTGSLFGTSSWAFNAISASHAPTALTSSYAVSSSNAATASFALSGNGAFSGSFSGSFFGNGGGLTNISASSVVGLNLSLISSGSVTASTDPAYGFRVNANSQLSGSTQITGSLGVTGSVSITGSLGSVFSANVDTLVFSGSILQTGSVSLTGSLSVTSGGITGSLFGTSSWAVSASYAVSSSNAQTASLAILAPAYTTTASFNQFSQSYNTGSFTGSFRGTAILTGSFSGSFSGNVDNINGTTNFIAKFDSPNSVDSSVIYQLDSHIAINETNFTTNDPEALYVFQTHPTSINVITGKGNLNNYLQINIQNTNQGISASSDIVATANNGNETSNYIDMGINSENYAQNFIGGPNDAYLYSIANNLHIGNAATNGSHLGFFVGGDDIEANNKLQLNPDNRHTMSGSLALTGSLNVKEGITGSLYGTSSWAVSASFSEIASIAILAPAYTTTASFNQFTSSYYIDSASFSSSISELSQSFLQTSASYASASGSLSTRVTNLESTASVLTTASASFAIVSSSFASTSESLSIRVTDLESTASILTTASASFAVVSASYADASQSLSTRVVTLENASSSFAADSGSNSIRLTNLESTASVLTTASASFALVSQSYSAFSQSYNTGSFTGSFVGEGYLTGSLFGTSSWANNAVTASHVLNAVSASYAATASSADNFFIRQDATASNLLVTNTITAQTLVVQTITSSVDFVTGSTRFGTELSNTHQFTGSVTITGSLSLNNSPVVTNSTFTPFSSSIASRATQLESTASILTNASASFAQQSGSNSIRLTNLESTASVLTTASASFAVVSASYASASGSLSTRTTNLESTASVLTTASASFALVSASYSAFSQSYNTGSFTGSFTGIGNLTGSLFGTSSWAINAISASHAPSSATASFATTASFAQTASVALSGNGPFSGSFSGSFFGNGAGLTNISASSVVGLNLSLISSGSVTASTDPAYGFRVNSNTQISGSTQITGSLGVTGSVNISGSFGDVFNTNIDTMILTGSFFQSGSTFVTGTLSVFGGITGSLFGTASWAQNATTASHAVSALSSSFAATASSADNFFVRQNVTASNALIIGTLTAQTIVAQVITSSTDFVTGSTRFGSQLTNTHQFTGSVTITGSLSVNDSPVVTNSTFTPFSSSVSTRVTNLESTASVLTTASASFAIVSSSYSAASQSLSTRTTNLESTASILTTASASFAIVSSSYSAFSQSYNTGSFTGSFNGVGNITGSLFGTSSWSLNAITASNALTASFVPTSSLTGNFFVQGGNSFGTQALLGTNDNQNLAFETSGSVRMFISSSGAVGINTTTPSASLSLDVNGNARIATNLTIQSGDIIFGAANRFIATSGAPLDTIFTSTVRSLQTLRSSGGTNGITFTNNSPTNTMRIWDNGNVLIQTGGTYTDSGFKLDVSGSTRIQNTLIVTGSLTAPNITGSLFGTASWALNAVTASHVLNAVSASYAATASSADDFLIRQNATASNLLVNNTITAQTLVVQTITSSVDFVTGSTRFGTQLTNTHQFTGSVTITGSLSLNNSPVVTDSTFTPFSSSVSTRLVTLENASASFASDSGSNSTRLTNLESTASVLTSASASFAQDSGSNSIRLTNLESTASVLTTASASFALVSSSYAALSGSFRSGSYTGSFTGVGNLTGSLFGTASWALNAVTASNALTSSFVLNAISASFASTASFVNPLVQNVQITGSTNISGSINVNGGLSFTGASGTAIISTNAANYGTARIGQIGGFDFQYAAFNSGQTVVGYHTNIGRNGLVTQGGGTLHVWNQSSPAQPIVFGGQNSAEVFRIATNGFIGVGKTNPSVILDISGSQRITGSLIVTQGITGSLFGTSSWALNALTSSFVLNAVSASFAATASSADTFVIRQDATASNLLVNNTITAQTLVVQTITSSVDFVTGSTRFGTQLTNTHQFTGSVSVTGSLSVNDSPVITAATFTPTSSSISTRVTNLESTASILTSASASFAIVSASYSAFSQSYSTGSFTGSFTGVLIGTASWASNATTASFVLNAVSSSYALTASNVQGGLATYVPLWNTDTSLTSSYINQSGNIIKTTYNGTDRGLTLNYNFDSYILGNPGVGNNTYLQVFDGGSVINVYSPSYTYFNDKVGVRIIPTNPGLAVSGSLEVTGPGITKLINTNAEITGALNVSAGITGSLFGTSSWALNAVTSSNALQAVSASFATTASFAQTASFVATSSLVGNFFIQGGNSFGIQALLGTNDNQNLAFETSGSTRMLISGSNGFVGIGTLSPLARLDISGSVPATASIGRAVLVQNNISAVANNDVLVGLDVQPTYTAGAFTGVVSTDLRTRNAGVVIGSNYGFGANHGYANDGIFQIKDVGSSGNLSGNLTTQIVLRQAGSPSSYNSNYWGFIEQNTNGMLINSGRYVSLFLRAGGSGGATGNISLQTSNAQTSVYIVGSSQNVLINTTTDSGFKLDVAASGTSGSFRSIGASVISGSLLVTGSQRITGSLNVSAGITGSLFGTASWALNATTASFVLNAVSASFAATASSADDFLIRQNATASNLLVNNTITAQTLVVQTITSSVDFVTGSTRFGSLLTNTHQFTGSVTITGSLSVNDSPVITNATFTPTSSSISTRVTNLESTASVLTNASASFAQQSGSNSTRLTNLESTASVLTTASASFALVSSSYSAFSQSYNTGSFTGSFTGVGNLTGSLFGTSSWALNVISASFATTASYVTGSIFTNANSAASASFAQTASFVISASFAQTASYVNPLRQTVIVSGAIDFTPTTDPDPTGANLRDTYLFVSSSNTALGSDLYHRQNGNLVKWKWIEGGSLNTGILYGGVVTYGGSNVYVSSGSGIIVDYNASSGSEINPIINYVNWGPLTSSITNIATTQVTYIYIDSNGALQQQSIPFTPQQYSNALPLGAVGHFNYSTVSAFGGIRSTAYAQPEQANQFIDAFGPLKVGGYSIAAQPSSLRYSVGSGTSFIHGGFYDNNPDFPSILDSNSAPTASIVRCYISGSNTVFDTNNGTLYTTINPGFYNDVTTGVTSSISNNKWTIQRVFTYPATNTTYVYYGQNVYDTLTLALDGLAADTFSEGATKDFTTLIGYLVVKSNTTDLSLTENKILAGGLFRAAGAGGAGGAVAAAALDDLSDVTITSPTNGQALIYNSGVWINGTPLNATSASLATTASFVRNAVSSSFATSASLATTASYVLQAVSASFATTASNATTASFVLNAVSASFAATASSVNTLIQPVVITGSLAVNGNATISTNAGRLNLLQNTAGSVFNGIDFLSFNNSTISSLLINQGTGEFRLLTNPSYFPTIYSNGGEAMRIPISRNVLIGTTTDSGFRLDVSGSARITNNLTVSGSTLLTGSVQITGSLNAPNITGSLFGTSSWALNAVTSSNATTASFVLNAVSASFAATASSADNFLIRQNATASNLLVNNTITAQTLVVQTITSSVDFVTGSTRFGTQLTNTHQFTGSVTITGSLSLNDSPVITNAIFTPVSSSVSTRLTNLESTASVLTTASASFALVSSSYSAFSQSYSTGSFTGSFIGTLIGTASWAQNAVTSSYVLNAESSSFAISASFAATASNATTASFVLQAVSASFAATASSVNTLIQPVTISGSLTVVTGSGIEFQVTNTGVNIGNASTDRHNVTGSLNITGSLNLVGNQTITGSLAISSSLFAYQQNPSVTTGSFQTIASVATGSYRCAFFDYVTFSGSISRAGTVYTIWSGSATEFTETYTQDLGGSTSVVTLQTAISAGNIQLQAGISGSAWTVRSLVRLL